MRIKSHASSIYTGMTAAGLGALALPGAFLYLKWAAGEATIAMHVVMAPFLLMGLLLVTLGARGVIRRLTGGAWQLDIPDAGGALGEPLAATLLPPHSVQVDGELNCRLRLVERASAGGGRTQITTAWQTHWTAPVASVHPRLGVALTLPFPAQGVVTMAFAGGAGYRWQLNVAVPSGGSTEELVFDVPVRTGTPL